MQARAGVRGVSLSGHDQPFNHRGAELLILFAVRAGGLWGQLDILDLALPGQGALVICMGVGGAGIV
ncbi:hypothetical protein AAGG49_22075, partial [Stenotrophomonas maltophilia]|uniref:hypothetical protein n=1 Tax=Stenotrophomonas maltophilia TaxID=40324 RepID=UPI00313D64F9